MPSPQIHAQKKGTKFAGGWRLCRWLRSLKWNFNRTGCDKEQLLLCSVIWMREKLLATPCSEARMVQNSARRIHGRHWIWGTIFLYKWNNWMLESWQEHPFLSTFFSTPPHEALLLKKLGQRREQVHEPLHVRGHSHVCDLRKMSVDWSVQLSEILLSR